MEENNYSGTSAHRSLPNPWSVHDENRPDECNHCHNCGHSPHDTHHLFDCPSKPTTLTVESLWTAPTENAKHIYLAIDETINQQQQVSIKTDIYNCYVLFSPPVIRHDATVNNADLERRMQPARGRFARFDLDRQIASTFPAHWKVGPAPVFWASQPLEPLPTSLSSLDLWTNPDKVEPFLATWGERLLPAT